MWEISQKTLINMAADRGAFIDQSQSFNVFIAEPNFQKLSSMHFYAWKKGLKTGMYYLRTRPAADAIKFTVDQLALSQSSRTEAASAAPANSEVGKEDNATPNTVTSSTSMLLSPASSMPPSSPNNKKTDKDDSYEEATYCTNKEGCLVCGS